MLLASAGADVISQLDRFKESFLWAAAKGGRVEECESLVQIGADVNWQSPQGDTPLIAACRNGHSPTALCLLDHNAEVNATAGDGQTALHFSCCRGNEAVAKALILRGADVFARNNNGATAFESTGRHVPAGMLRRLTIVAQRQRRNRSHVESGTAASTLRHHPADSSVDTLRRLSGRTNEQNIKEFRARRRYEMNQEHAAHTHDGTGGSVGERLLLLSRGRDGGGSEGGNRTAAGRGGNDASDRQSEIFSRGGGDQEEANDSERTVGASMGSGGEESPAHHRARDDNQDRSGRTTFPSIAPATAMASTLQRATQSESSIPPSSDRSLSTSGARVGEGLDSLEGYHGVQRRVASRGNTTSLSGETGLLDRLSLNAAAGRRDGWAGDGFHSSDDEDLNSDSGGRETSIRLLGGIHRGPTMRQGRLPISRARGDASLPGSMRVLSTVNYISHAQSAAISAMISSSATSPGSTSSSDESTISDAMIPPGGRAFSSSSLWNDPGDGGSDSVRAGIVGSVASIGAGARAAATFLAPTTNASTIAAYSTDRSGSTSPTGRSSTVAPGGVEGPAEAFEQADAPYAGAGSADSTAGTSGTRRSDCPQSKPGNMPNDHVGLIRMLWLQEKESRLAAEAEADAVRFQSTRVWNELVRSEKQVLGLEESLATTREERDMLRATFRGEEVTGRSLQDLETLEKDIRRSLDGVCKERDRILKAQITKDEQRLCVVCQENERGVLLLPCRHLCVCKSCSERPELSSCPLCRDDIAERLVVYS